MAPLDIYDFVDVRSYLTRWLARPEAPSQRVLADAMEVSPALMTGVLQGKKKLVLNRIPSLAAALGLTDQEGQYLQAMVVLDRAATPAERRPALEHLIGLRRVHESRDVTAAMWDIYSRWWYQAISELSACEGFQDDPRWIAKTLVPQVTVEQARDALDVLRAVGLLAGGVPVIWATGPEVSERILGLAVAAAMTDHMKLAGEALGRFPASDVHFTSLTLAVDPDRLVDLKEAIGAFVKATGALVTSGHPKNRRVFQFLVQLYPLSKVTE